MLLVVLSHVLDSIVLAGAFQGCGFCIVLPGHQLVNKGIAPFYDFGNFLDLSFFDFFVKDFFVLSIIRAIGRFFSSLGDVEFFIRRCLNKDIVCFFGRRHDVNYLFDRLGLDDFVGLL